MTYDEFAALALTLPGVVEVVKKSEIDLVRDGRHIGRLREKGTAFALRLPWDRVDALLASDPEVFFVTKHYDGWPYVLARLDKLDPDMAAELLHDSWEVAPETLPLRPKSGA
ncbi:MAG: hypothetical protein JST30_09645 [Armatimonadetes bacterium]|nr:hypothetical protein [Armatimonadota bacterium]